MRSAWAIDSSLPTQSITTSAPPVSVPDASSERERRRTARTSCSGSIATSAPSSSANVRWCAYLAPTASHAGGVSWASAATVHRPRVPAPSTATVVVASTPAAMAACTAQAVGSTITASSSESSSGTGWSCASWATRPPLDHPPPVSVQNPIWSPGARRPKATRSHPPVAPSAHAAQGGTMPRATQPRTGSITTRESVSSRVPTTSCPGTKGKLTTSSK